ncbi:MAG: metallophosphoesterase [Xenococcaceae cyanobacterium MO_207.B15]|nr:metallophosphoesterase [Xenococcaceae cyanobacterium MO_207.B15]
MTLNFKFAIVSDLHIAVPETIENRPSRFHLVEVSIPALETALEHLETLPLDFLLLPGDLTQDGEIENHQWLANRLAKLPFPTYVIPGNHDVPNLLATENYIGFNDFPKYYQNYGYQNTEQLYYTQEILPGVQLIALNSNTFARDGQQIGCLDDEQLLWLESILQKTNNQLVLLTIHHNIIEHLPHQSKHPLGKRYILDNRIALLDLLQKYGVKFIFTGHLHVQDVAEFKGIYEICTGSMVSYPHPYRVIEVTKQDNNKIQLNIQSHRIKSLAGWENLAETSREYLGDRSPQFMMRLLTSPPLNLSSTEAAKYTPHLRYFWSDIAAGDSCFDFPQFPPNLRKYFQQFSAFDPEGKLNLIDNQATLIVDG